MLPPNYVVSVALQHLIDCFIKKHNALEDITYSVIIEFLLVYKNPSHQFTLCLQMTLRWNPDCAHDFRFRISDVRLINFSYNYLFIFCLDVESKQMTLVMVNLPPCNILEGDYEVCFALHTAYCQVEDQIKAAMG